MHEIHATPIFYLNMAAELLAKQDPRVRNLASLLAVKIKKQDSKNYISHESTMAALFEALIADEKFARERCGVEIKKYNVTTQADVDAHMEEVGNTPHNNSNPSICAHISKEHIYIFSFLTTPNLVQETAGLCMNHEPPTSVSVSSYSKVFEAMKGFRPTLN